MDQSFLLCFMCPLVSSIHEMILKKCSNLSDLTEECLFSCIKESIAQQSNNLTLKKELKYKVNSIMEKQESIEQLNDHNENNNEYHQEQQKQLDILNEEEKVIDFSIEQYEEECKEFLETQYNLNSESINTITTNQVKDYLIKKYPEYKKQIKSKDSGKFILQIFNKWAESKEGDKDNKDDKVEVKEMKEMKEMKKVKEVKEVKQNNKKDNKKELSKEEKKNEIKQDNNTKETKDQKNNNLKKDKEENKQEEPKCGVICSYDSCDTKCKKVRVLKDGKVYCGKHHPIMEKKLNEN